MPGDFAAKTLRYPGDRSELKTIADLGKKEKLEKRAERSREMTGTKAPDWTLTNLEGETIQLSDYRGQYVVLDFWYVGCAPCVTAMPDIQRLKEQFDPAQVKVIGIETRIADPEKLKTFLAKQEVDYETVLAAEHEEVANAYRIYAYPTFLIIDPEGTIVHFHTGYTRDAFKKVQKILKKALK